MPQHFGLYRSFERNFMKKIAIIGKGLSGSLAVSHLSKYLTNSEIVWIFDSETPTQAVGEGSVLTFPKTLFNSFGFSHYKDLPKIDGTIKYGVYKKYWGSEIKEFFHDFPPPAVALHFNARKLHDYVYQNISKKVKIIDSHINNNEIDADYVFDCSGTPHDLSNHTISEYIPVNSVYINQCYWDGPKFNHTLTIARPYGWVFGIPLTNRCSIGYLYNNQINNLDEIKEDVMNIFSEFDLEPSEDTNSFNFSSYYSKENFTNRTGYNGNASFFLEPLEATSTGHIDFCNRSMFDLIEGNETYREANKQYAARIQQTENMIMFHYLAGSVFNTDFWNFAKERANECLGLRLKNDEHFLHMYNEIKDIKDDTFLETTRYTAEYSVWWQGSFVQNFNGLNIHNKIQKLLGV